MNFQAVKGTRDFYPEQMARRNWLIDAWRRVSLRNGFVEFDGPELEYLDLYRAKSGQEIVAQLFGLSDRGGRELALRPEITPTLARMVNARINSLPRPIKWFSLPRLFRAENPQRGRLREFFQWNIDIIGSDDVLADAECIFTAVDLLQEVGLTPADAVVRYSSRRLLAAVLRRVGLADEQTPPVLAALDKRSRLPAEAFDEMFAKAMPDASARQTVLALLDAGQAGLEGSGKAMAELAGDADVAAAIANLREFQAALAAFGIADWCRYDTGIVRGLAYYTGIVYEIFDTSASLRAVAGGGRYDNLLEVLGGPRIGATGLGMGDPVLSILLEEKGKLPAFAPRLDCFVLAGQEIPAAEQLKAVLAVVRPLRRSGLAADFAARAGAIGRGLKEANRRGARYALIVRPGKLSVKDLSSGEQVDVSIDGFLADIQKYVG